MLQSRRMNVADKKIPNTQERVLSSSPADDQRKIKRQLVVVGMAVALFVIVYQVFIPPIVGLADNGDFAYARWPFRIDVKDRADPHRFFHFIVVDYQFYEEEPRLFRLITTEDLNVGGAVLLWWLVSKEGIFDIRLMGAIHASIVLFALFLVLPLIGRLATWRAWVLAVLSLVIILDVSYVSYYNSFYADAASLVFLLLLVATYLRVSWTVGPVGVPRGVVLLLAMLLFLLSKSQRAPLGFVFLLLLIVERKRLLPRPRGLAIGLTVIGLSTFASMAQIPADYRAMAYYNVVFAELLPRSQQPALVLNELGLPAKYAVYSGSNAYSPQSALGQPESRSELVALASHQKLLAYYLRHPTILWRLITLGTNQATEFRPWGFGNFAKESNRGLGEQSRSFALWTGMKRLLFYKRPYHYLGAVSFCCLLLVWCATKSGRFLPAVLALSGMTAMEFALGALADVGETTRHLFVFNLLVDLQLLFLVAFVLWKPELVGFGRRWVREATASMGSAGSGAHNQIRMHGPQRSSLEKG